MNICILIPTAGEARSVITALRMRRTARSSYVYEAPDARVVLHICGMGVDNARMMAQAALSQGMNFLILAGFCGGLNERLEVGDVVVDDRYPDPDFAGAVIEIAAKRGIHVYEGTVFTASKLLATPREKIEAGVQTSAIAVDMEGSGVDDACRSMGIPFRSFRIVSDDMNQRLPSALCHVALDGSSTVRFWLTLMFFPWEWVDVCRALISSRRAAKNLATTLSDLTAALSGTSPSQGEVMRQRFAGDET